MTECLLVWSVLCSFTTLPQSSSWSQLYWVVQRGIWIHPLPWQGVVSDIMFLLGKGSFKFVMYKYIFHFFTFHLIGRFDLIKIPGKKKTWSYQRRHENSRSLVCLFCVCVCVGKSVYGWESPCLCPATWGWWSLSPVIRLCWEKTHRRPPVSPRTSVKGKA